MGKWIPMEKIKNLSLRKTIILYMSAALLITFFLSVWIINTADRTQRNLWRQYIDEDEMAAYEDDTGYIAEIPRPSRADMLHRDWMISEICDAVETWTMLVLPMLGSVAAVFYFYRNKIKEPLELLTKGSKKIQENQLDFPVEYPNKDEMGSLCREFDRMRLQLQENNQRLWGALEQERTLKAVIAHDIRSPLAVLRGYQETLMEFLPNQQLSLRDTEEILQSGMQQIDRLNGFVEQMQQLSGIEERETHCETIETDILLRYLGHTAKALTEERQCQAVIKKGCVPDAFSGDYSVICEVYENLLGNAVRYARQTITVTLEMTGEMLYLSLKDDGDGFQTGEEEITKPFFHDNLADDLKHFGLGMYLSKLYCEKHGGKLLLGSSESGGAYVKAGFHVFPEESENA